jgi:hypothetical protein
LAGCGAVIIMNVLLRPGVVIEGSASSSTYNEGTFLRKSQVAASGSLMHAERRRIRREKRNLY